MTATDIQLAMLVIATLTIFVGVTKAIISAGEKKQQFATLRADVDRHEAYFKTVITAEEHVTLQRACRSDVDRVIDAKLNAELKDVRLHNDEIFGDLYDQISVLNGNLCHLMGAMNIEPIRSPKRRRKTDASRDFEVG